MLLHYFNYYAVKETIDFSYTMKQESITPEQSDMKQVALSLLPTPEDDTAVQNNICVNMPRVLYNKIPYFKHMFDGVV